MDYTETESTSQQRSGNWEWKGSCPLQALCNLFVLLRYTGFLSHFYELLLAHKFCASFCAWVYMYSSFQKCQKWSILSRREWQISVGPHHEIELTHLEGQLASIIYGRAVNQMINWIKSQSKTDYLDSRCSGKILVVPRREHWQTFIIWSKNTVWKTSQWLREHPLK